MRIDLKNYEYMDIEDLKKISDIYDKVNDLIISTETVHEDLIDYMLNPFEKILTHHGVNLQESDF
jgi:hypothetical protein